MSKEWNDVDEASWESFPASDPPEWLGREPDAKEGAVPAPREGQPVVAGIFDDEEKAAEAVECLLQEHFDPPHDLSVIVSHRREHEDVPVPETFQVERGGVIGAGVGAVLAAAGVTLAGMTVGPITLAAAGPVLVALEAAYAGGATGFAIGALAGLDLPKDEVDFHAAHIHDGIVWVGVHAEGERAELARRILSDAGARHFQG